MPPKAYKGVNSFDKIEKNSMFDLENRYADM